jgi:hypothetical protein
VSWILVGPWWIIPTAIVITAVLSLSWLFINKTIPKIHEIVKCHIVNELDSVSLKTIYSEERLFDLINGTRSKVEESMGISELFMPSNNLTLDHQQKWESLGLTPVLMELRDILVR